MKKILFAFFLLAFACVEEPEIRTTRLTSDNSTDRSESTARVQHLCESGYPWTSGTPGGNGPITPHILFKNYVVWYTNTYPATNSYGLGMKFITFRVSNQGTATFKFSRKDGFPPWTTLTPGQYTDFTLEIPTCDVTGLNYTIKFKTERLSCGELRFRSQQIAADSPHSVTAFYPFDYVDHWNAPDCTL